MKETRHTGAGVGNGVCTQKQNINNNNNTCIKAVRTGRGVGALVGGGVGANVAGHVPPMATVTPEQNCTTSQHC